MKKYLFILLLLPLLCVGCEEPEIKNRKPVVRTYEDGYIRVSSWLETSEREKATVFEQGEQILLCYRLENITNDSLKVAYNLCYPQCWLGFGYIFNSDNDSIVARRIALWEPAIVEYAYFGPGVILDGYWTYPDGPLYKGCDNLPKGKYYVRFRPSWALEINDVDTCPSFDERPEFRIDFKVK